MPATSEYQGSFLGRISIRRNQVVSMEGNHEQELEDLEILQRNIADRLTDLLPPPPSSPDSGESHSDAFFSVAWLRKLLDVFLCCEAEFKAILIMGREPPVLLKPPLDRLISELLDRAVKALDICNAVMHGVDSVRYCQKLAEIAVAALEQRPLGEGHVRRAKKALSSMMAVLATEDKETNPHKSTERTWSFGRRGGSAGSAGSNKERAAGQFRSISWGVSKNWSAAKQIQAMSANLVLPRATEGSGLAMPVYLMSTVMVFAMTALVAAIPCQERTGLTTHLQLPRQGGWAQAMISLQEKIGEEWKKKEKKGSAGLMDEMQRVEKLGQSLIEFADSFQHPSTDMAEVAGQVAELSETCRRMEEGLVPLQQQIREVFHRIVRSRSEVLDVLEQAGKLASPAM